MAGGGARPTDSMGKSWNAGYIVASGNLPTDFRSNAAAEGQSRLTISRIAGMTDDPGVRDMLAFNVALDTYHQQLWLYGIQILVEEVFAEVEIKHSNAALDDVDAAQVL